MQPIERVRKPDEETAYSEMEVAYNTLVTQDLHLGTTEVVDDLDDPWFAVDVAANDEVYEVDPVHPLRRLSAWVRGRLAA